jgi:hypothetical protein
VSALAGGLEVKTVQCEVFWDGRNQECTDTSKSMAGAEEIGSGKAVDPDSNCGNLVGNRNISCGMKVKERPSE